MHAILFRAVARPANRRRVLAFLEQNCENSQAELGTIRFDILEDPLNRDAFFVYEVYVDRRAFLVHQKGKAFQTWKAHVMPELACFCILFEGKPAAVFVKSPKRNSEIRVR